MEEAILKKKVTLFNALAHPLRLKILLKLRRGSCCVCEIIPFVGSEQSNVSHHLAILRNANIVRSKKRGLEVWYEVIDPVIFELIDRADACIMEDLRTSRKMLEELAKQES
ncbi:helix-turn-helix transcriptional regulator [candidate division WOR-3 bacterium]|nr:helix-turn-helix transcriptional regulator [candidate division WOR-3 bacterium]